MQVGAQIGYLPQGSKPTMYPNLAIADADVIPVSADISSELSKNGLDTYSDINTLPSHHTPSLLGLVDKVD